MRGLLALAVLVSVGSSTLAQQAEAPAPPKRPVTVEKLEIPDHSKYGDEFTVVAHLANNSDRLVLANARLIINGGLPLTRKRNL